MSRYNSRSSPVPLDCKVYVGNLPSGASRTEIEDAFSYYGPIKNVWVARNPPGFAFVMFEDARDASDAVRGLDDRTVAGVRVRVELSSGESRRPRDGGRGFGGGRGGGGGFGGGRRGGMRDRDNERCYECGERGHFARDCRRRGSGGRSRSRSISRSRSRSRSRRSPKRSPPRYSRSRSRSRSRS